MTSATATAVKNSSASSPKQTLASSAAAVQRFLARIVQLAIPHADDPTHGILTASAGIARMTDDCAGPDEVLRRADRALYRAKTAGRNTLRLAAAPGDSA